MRHQKKGYKLGRTNTHRKATLAALANALIAHKRITTTQAKAKALRMYVEPLINRAKEDTTNNRRQVFRHLQSKESVKTLFGEIAGKIAERPGGYTRVVKLGQRAGDSAEMAVIELVDYNDIKPAGTDRSRRRRTRRGGGGGSRSRSKKTTAATPVVAEEVLDDTEVVEAETEEAAAAEEATEDVAVAEEEADVEEPTDEEAVEAAAAEADVAEEEAVEAEEAEVEEPTGEAEEAGDEDEKKDA